MSRKVVLVLALLLLGNLVVGIISISESKYADTNSMDEALNLERPWFINEVAAKDLSGTAAIADISNEAGMSVYVKSTTAINLTKAKTAFTRGVEIETADYIIGLIPISGYNTAWDPTLQVNITWDAHVLVHKTGWILAYYPKEYVSARALNEKQQVIGGATKLSLAIDAVIAKAGNKFGNKSYFNFQYPDATKMLVIYFKNGQDPRIKLPASLTYYEKSLMLFKGDRYSDTGFYIEDNKIALTDYGFQYHDISTNLTEGTFIQTWSSTSATWGMIVILYS